MSAAYPTAGARHRVSRQRICADHTRRGPPSVAPSNSSVPPNAIALARRLASPLGDVVGDTTGADGEVVVDSDDPQLLQQFVNPLAKVLRV